MKTFSKIILLFAAIIFSNKSFAQWSNLLSENVDGCSIPALPSGFTSYPAATVGFETDSTNASDCTNASGGDNIVIRNVNSATGDYILYFPTFSTVGKSVVSLSWNSRVSTHFMDMGSSVNSLEYSTDGNNWTALSYAENGPTSAWAQVNNGSTIDFPSGALDKDSVKLRLNVHIVNNTDGTYRMDDILIIGYHDNSGTFAPNLSAQPEVSVYPNPSSGEIVLNTPDNGIFELTDVLGKQVMLSECNAGVIHLDGSALSKGIYFILFTEAESGKQFTAKWMHL